MGYGFGPGMDNPVKKPVQEKPKAKTPVQPHKPQKQTKKQPPAPFFPFDKIFGGMWKKK